MQLVGFTIEIYYGAQPYEHQSYAACLADAVNFLVAKIHQMNFYGWFVFPRVFKYVTADRWKVKGQKSCPWSPTHMSQRLRPPIRHQIELKR